MKITLKTLVEKTVEIPPFWKFKRNEKQVFMLLDEANCFQVYDGSWDGYCLPELRGMKLDWLTWDEEIVPISEAEFKVMFLKVSIELEKLSN
jgi:hypothetical protein